MKKVALISALTLGLASCGTTGSVDPATSTANTLSSVANAIAGYVNTGWKVLTSDAAPTACAVAASVSNYGSLLSTAGQLTKFGPLVDVSVAAVSAIANGPLCKTLLAGGTITDPIGLIAQIATTVAQVQSVTQGKVTAVAATAPSINKLSSKLGATSPLIVKQALFNDQLRVKLNNLKYSHHR